MKCGTSCITPQTNVAKLNASMRRLGLPSSTTCGARSPFEHEKGPLIKRETIELVRAYYKNGLFAV
jgi:hypothetical protein